MMAMTQKRRKAEERLDYFSVQDAFFGRYGKTYSL